MRPITLNYLFSPITNLKGVGAKTAKLIGKLVTTRKSAAAQDSAETTSSKADTNSRIVDLIYHCPISITDRRNSPPLNEAKSGDIITVVVTVEAHIPAYDPRQPLKIRCTSPTGYLTLVFFKTYSNYIEDTFPIGRKIVVSGKVDRYNDELQMAHPDYVGPVEKLAEIKKIERNYPLTAGLFQKQVRKAIDEALQNINDLPEWIDSTILKQEKWDSWKKSIEELHNPQSEKNLLPETNCKRRLAYDELLANQLAMGIVRQKINKAEGRPLTIDNSENGLRAKLMANLGFKLTNGQKQILADIDKDLASPQKMLRLLQGDVGSGKTVVALLSMLTAIQNGKQAAIMVPLSILAEQHYAWISKVCESLNLNIAILTGKITGKKREQVLNDLKDGKIDILVGTHALFQSNVEFKDLAVIVIDEQHRFGVLQRIAILKKGTTPDILLMTATPIPRTLMLASYGDMDISQLQEKPANRLPIDTRIMSLKKVDEVRDGIKRAINKGEKVFWICPLIEESEELDLAAVQDRYLEFQRIYGSEHVAMIHGKMKPQEKESIMEEFANPNSKVKILVATTVIEVGIDVPDATIMVIEHSERFGLSQLHQLRGRVGRSDKKSYCILLYGVQLSQAGVKRLGIMRETNDGFRIAEEDLKIRGAGEMLGTKQSGFAEYRIANLSVHYDLLGMAGKHARVVLNKLEQSSSEAAFSGSKEWEAVSTLLYLFEYDAYIRMVEGG